MYAAERLAHLAGVRTHLAQLGVALSGDDEQRAEHRAQDEPLRHHDVDGHCAGGGAEHESRGDDDEVDDGDVLQPHAVGDRRRPRTWPGSPTVCQRPVKPANAAPGGEEHRSDDLAGSNRDDAGGDRSEPLRRMAAVGLDVERVVPEVDAAGGEAERRRTRAARGRAPASCRAPPPRRGPRRRAGSSSTGAGAPSAADPHHRDRWCRPAFGRRHAAVHRHVVADHAELIPAGRFRSAPSQTAWSASRSMAWSPAESPYAQSSTRSAAAVAGREPLVQAAHLLVTTTVSPIQLARYSMKRRRPPARCTTPRRRRAGRRAGAGTHRTTPTRARRRARGPGDRGARPASGAGSTRRRPVRRSAGRDR